MRYAIVIESAGSNSSACVPDLPACVATEGDPPRVGKEIREAIAFHLDGLHEDGIAIPPPPSVVEYLDIAA